MIPRLIVTGPKGSGKSSFFNEICSKWLEASWGFRTLCNRYNGINHVFISSWTGYECFCVAEINIADKRILHLEPASFEVYGAAFIREALKYGTVLMDELGRLEQCAPSFIKAVKEVSESINGYAAIISEESLEFWEFLVMQKGVLKIDLGQTNMKDAYLRVCRYLNS